MATAQRRAREIENLRRAILDAARDLFATQDYQAVSLRKIAEKIEYSPAAIYRYFSDKDEILFNLIDEGFTLLNDRVRALQVEDPVERIRQAGHVYLDFALTQPRYYRLMFQLDKSEMTEKYMPGCTSAHSVFGFVYQSVMDAIATGQFVESAPPIVIACGIWSAMHGAVSLALSSHLNFMMPAELNEAFFTHMIESVIRGNLKSQ